jgi:hypothetical protein
MGSFDAGPRPTSLRRKSSLRLFGHRRAERVKLLLGIQDMGSGIEDRRCEISRQDEELKKAIANVL